MGLAVDVKDLFRVQADNPRPDPSPRKGVGEAFRSEVGGRGWPRRLSHPPDLPWDIWEQVKGQMGEEQPSPVLVAAISATTSCSAAVSAPMPLLSSQPRSISDYSAPSTLPKQLLH